MRLTFVEACIYWGQMDEDVESGRCDDGMAAEESRVTIRDLMMMQPLNPFVPLQFKVLSIRDEQPIEHI